MQDYCLELIHDDPQSLIPLLDDDFLFGLLEGNDLQLEEIVICDCLIEWGIQRTPGLESESGDKISKEITTLEIWNGCKNKWTDENYEGLKDTLRDFLPLIRFLEISSDDFYHGIHLYRRIVTRQIYVEII